MPKRPELRRVLVIGSGPIVIGQAAEFDYSGTQACQALREEGLEVVLVNSNPATIMTDPQMADRVYLEPLTAEFLERVLARERPQGLVPTLGGQVGLNLARELAEAGVLERYGVELLGTPLEAIRRAEDRGEFKALMQSIGEPVPGSTVVTTVEAALTFAERVGFPLVVRPAYTLGGTGGGMARDAASLVEVVRGALRISPIGQCLVECSVEGWKEIEFEVMRDASGTCITVCNMENVDPCGVHTGDSVVVAPVQTLTDREYQMLRTAALKIITALGIQGGCNIQFALHPTSRQYVVIEVNPRVSRSSALASKATGYPIARVAAKIAVGLRLDEIRNPITGNTYAAFEPTLDYVVVKIPRFPFDKFHTASRTLGTQMKATGEVMAIERTFPAALLKAVRSLEVGRDGLTHPRMAALDDTQLEQLVATPSDERLFAVAEALRRGWPAQRVAEVSRIDRFFVQGIGAIVAMEQELYAQGAQGLTRERLLRAKRLGLSDATIARLVKLDPSEVRRRRLALGVRPVYKMVDTCAAEFEAVTPYYYSTYEGEDESRPGRGCKAAVLGSGPIRIGQGIEFDYSAVHAAWALRDEGVESVIINNNPETVSTDFNTSSRLYFEPLTFEDVMNVLEAESQGGPVEGILCQFGGQTAINLAGPLAAAGIQVLGTPVEEMDRAEDRDKFDRLLEQLGIPRPAGGAALNTEQALAIARRVGYPVLVRPSYVLGGRAMQIVYDDDELREYMRDAVEVSESRPVLVDKYLQGTEVEVDAVADGEEVLVGGIMEHVERAGVHSGDSIAVYPALHIPYRVREAILDYTARLATALRVRGLINIQYVVYEDQLYVLEVNPRASRTVPFLSKAAGLPLARVAARIMMGRRLRELGLRGGLWPEPRRVAVKAPVFSWQKLSMVDVALSPEMKSTGEVMGCDVDFPRAFYKALLAAGLRVPRQGTVLFTVADDDKPEAMPIAGEFAAMGFRVVATSGTASALEACKVPVTRVNKVSEGSPNIVDFLREGRIDLVVNTLGRRRRQVARDGFLIRRAAVESGVPCLTSLDTARAVARVLAALHGGEPPGVEAVQDWPVVAAPQAVVAGS